MNFSECKSESDLKLFLDNLLLNTKNEKRFFHYTSLTTAVKIFKSKKIRFSKIASMNDLLENTWCGKKTDNDFFFCLSQSEECFGMWAMYGGLKLDKRTNGYVKIAFPKTAIEEILESKAQGITSRGVVYANLKGNEHKPSFQSNLHFCNDSNNNRISITKNLAGYVKDISWQYENEIRLNVKSMDENAHVDFSLSKDLLLTLKIIPSPIADFEKTKKTFTRQLEKSKYNKNELENIFEANEFSGYLKI
ncbi:MAG: DUF2971 domain-containing protein [Treponema sp.]|nr:DUF2971 domain-containing protein [Treponema sp.]